MNTNTSNKLRSVVLVRMETSRRLSVQRVKDEIVAGLRALGVTVGESPYDPLPRWEGEITVEVSMGLEASELQGPPDVVEVLIARAAANFVHATFGQHAITIRSLELKAQIRPGASVGGCVIGFDLDDA